MQPISYARHQFPPAIIQHAVWLYLRFTLSYRDVEDLLAERGLDVSYETVRRWVGKFGPAIARNLRQLRCRPSSRWHLDEMVVRISGRQMYLWRAVNDEGEVLEVLIQRRRNKAAARKLIRKLLKKHGFAPTRVTTDKLRSYGAAFKEIGLRADHEQGAYQNNRAEVSHQPLRVMISSKSEQAFMAPVYLKASGETAGFQIWTSLLMHFAAVIRQLRKRRRVGTLRGLRMASGSGVPFLKDFRHGSFAA